MILKFDTPSFLSVLNEAFEDPFLNGAPDKSQSDVASLDLSKEQTLGLLINRQYIITILQEVLNQPDFSADDTIYLDMFIARNLPKFPQYLLLSSSVLNDVLQRLCNYPGHDIFDDAQLSVEYLLSAYRPSNLQSLLPLFRKVGFFRVLKGIYRSERLSRNLLETYFEDPNDRYSVFDCISDCLGPHSGLVKRHVKEIYEILQSHAVELVSLDAVKTAQTIDLHAPVLHEDFLGALPEKSELQYIYLRTLFETDKKEEEATKSLNSKFMELHLQLMCRFEPSLVATFIEKVHIPDLRLEQVLPYMEKSGVVDAAIMLMTRDGRFSEAMNRLVEHLTKIESLTLGLVTALAGESLPTNVDAIKVLLNSLIKYTDVGIWLCQNYSQRSDGSGLVSASRKLILSQNLLPEEVLWLDIIDAIVQITRNLTSSFEKVEPVEISEHGPILTRMRTPAQRVFTALLTLTSSPNNSSTGISFMKILRAFLARASLTSPNLSDLRAVLASVFSAYAYEESILRLANRFLEKDLFLSVQVANNLRQRGWRPRGPNCEGCSRRLWGPKAPGDIYSKWEKREMLNIKRRKERSTELAGGHIERGKGRARLQMTTGSIVDENSCLMIADNVDMEDDEEESLNTKRLVGQKELDLGPLIVLACRHTYHQSCLENMQGEEVAVLDSREFRCPIDG
ncbi:putative golgi complex component (Vps8) [Blumeria hordei DH14]|uniref:Putative golgi complex component (Vps8) n=1 Tax=Blumeria graminis f. sp. hordei (strain DH14) TaxID=546991 RepID=N1JF93_BLUG1|nr:putative golgi complex component (Vps8) [Blumeria hordei DH14]